PVQPGDIYLICSDGLSGPVSDEEMGAIATTLPAQEACRFLVHLANLRGGPDNITVMIVRVGSSPANSVSSEPSTAKHGLRRFSWTIVLLILGLILAAIAVNLASDSFYIRASGRMAASVVFFVLAIASILGGLLGLAMHYARHKGLSSANGRVLGLHVYRQAECHVDRPLLDRLVEAEKVLSQQIRDNHWEVDWDSNQIHRQEGEKALSE